MTMGKVAMIAKMTAAEGKREELLETLQGVFPEVEKEQGTELYLLHRDEREPDVVWMYELYTDNDGFRAHASNAALKEVATSLIGLLAGPPEMTRLELVGGVNSPS